MAGVKLSVMDWCSFENGREPDARAFFAHARSLGITGAEMVAPERRAAARAAGLRLISLDGPGMLQGLNRLEHHATLLPQIGQMLLDAAAVGIRWIVVFSGNREGQSDREGIANCATGLRQLLPVCDCAGVGLLFEMLNGSDHPDYQAVHGRYGFELVERLGSPHVKVLYDVYHMEKAGDDFMSDIRANLPLIGHFHCAACPDRTGVADSRTADYAAIARLALTGGYDGWFGQEFLPRLDYRRELAAACASFGSV